MVGRSFQADRVGDSFLKLEKHLLVRCIRKGKGKREGRHREEITHGYELGSHPKNKRS